ncbi:MAG: glycosyltransferase family 2 protein [Gemmatimonadota bacterium]
MTLAAGQPFSAAALPGTELELSIVMPCLNEADTLASCVGKARRAMAEAGIAGEVIVADNGSTDGSQAIAEREGGRVVPIAMRGYGSALMGGIAAARGRYVLMGDADDSYDFLESARFLGPLRAGAQLVQGCRLPSGGGTVAPGAMPFLHRWWGNPMFSAMARRWYGAPIHDIYCGMRAFRRDLIEPLDLRCTGMEFATEMIIKATIHGARITEVPITLHKDGRTTHAPHLRTFRDGWRTLRFFLMYSPRWLFLMPGLLLGFAGLLCYALALPQVTIGRVTFDVHTLLFGSLAIICGFQSILFAVMTKTFAATVGMLPMDPRLSRAYALLNLERGLIVAGLTMVLGLALLGVAIAQWVAVDFGALNYARTMRWVIPGVTLTTLGWQAILSGFFLSILGLSRR